MFMNLYKKSNINIHMIDKFNLNIFLMINKSIIIIIYYILTFNILFFIK
jgi:hypothetical protein